MELDPNDVIDELLKQIARLSRENAMLSVALGKKNNDLTKSE
jgi:hypothetical protein